MVFYLGAAASYIALDLAVGFSLLGHASLAFILAAALPGAAVLVRRREPALSLMLGLFLALALTLPGLDLGPRKAFLRAAVGIRPGMSLVALDQQMRHFERLPATPGALDIAGSIVYHHSFGPGDSDAVRVWIVDGRVADSQLLPD